MKLKAVLILGPNIRKISSPQSWEKINQLYSKDNYLIIGDGISDIRLEDLTQLKDKINSDTRIDIHTHGKFKFIYYLELSELIPVSKIFKKLGELNNNNPLNVHIWSCESSHALYQVTFLPEGSVLSTHSQFDTAIADLLLYSLEKAIINLQNNNFPISPYQALIDNISTDFIQEGGFVANYNYFYFNFYFQPKTRQSLENPEEYLVNNVKNIINSYENLFKIASALNQTNKYYLKENTLIPHNFSELEINDFRFGNFIYNCDQNRQINESIHLLEKLDILNYIERDEINTSLLLSVAASKDHLEVAEFLLNNNVNPNISNFDGLTPLYNAVQYGKSKMVEKLLQYNADPNKALFIDRTAPINFAANKGYIDIVKLLLVSNADVNSLKENGASTLFVAAQNGHFKIIDLLLSYGANPYLVRNDNISPMFVSAYYGHIKVVELLTKCGVNPFLTVEDDEMIFYAKSNGHLIIADLLQNIKLGIVNYTASDCPVNTNKNPYLNNYQPEEVIGKIENYFDEL